MFCSHRNIHVLNVPAAAAEMRAHLATASIDRRHDAAREALVAVLGTDASIFMVAVDYLAALDKLIEVTILPLFTSASLRAVSSLAEDIMEFTAGVALPVRHASAATLFRHYRHKLAMDLLTLANADHDVEDAIRARWPGRILDGFELAAAAILDEAAMRYTSPPPAAH